MSQWQVELEGDEIDLRFLTQHFQGPEFSVTLIDSKYYLDSDVFNAMSDPSAVYSYASEELLPVMRTLAINPSRGAQAVRIGGISRLNPDGSRQHARFVFASAALVAEFRGLADGTLIGPDGKVVPSPQPALSARRLQSALKDPKAKEAVHCFDAYRPNSTDAWFNLFKVFEIIEGDLDKDIKKAHRKMVNQGWVTDAEIEGFRESAHNAQVSGSRARHAKRWTPKAPPLGEQASADMIRRLLFHWLDSRP